jgi:hypothetical protein
VALLSGGPRAPRLRALELAALALAGCYNPSPPGGSYRCSTADQACPSGQHCTCGLCVKHDAEAACGFKVDAQSPLNVVEHQAFSLTVTATQADGNGLASGFNGAVALASSWGDVTPASVTLSGGKATLQVSLNRETIAPQSAAITASFAAAKGKSGKIYVAPPTFTRDPTPLIPPASLAAPFGFANHFVAEADVEKTSDGYRMYFGGAGTMVQGTYAIGVATSTDGKTFTAKSAPVLVAGDAAFDMVSIASPAVFEAADGYHLAFAGKAAGSTPTDFDGQIGVASSGDGLSLFGLGSKMPAIGYNDCAYCDAGLSGPTVLRDPFGDPTVDGGSSGWLMFFSARKTVSPTVTSVALGRASSSDGIHFTAEPAPILSGDVFGEALLVSPKVLVDGTVFKMWYTFAHAVDVPTGDLCDVRVKVEIGYATSSDGFYWIRSPSNPVVSIGGSGWDMDSHALLVTSVLPLDGIDPASGVQLFYAPIRRTLLPVLGFNCLANGIGRATRP